MKAIEETWFFSYDAAAVVRVPDEYGEVVAAEYISKENGNLIAAAPELYRALAACISLDHNSNDNEFAKAHDLAAEAMRKARGE